MILHHYPRSSFVILLFSIGTCYQYRKLDSERRLITFMYGVDIMIINHVFLLELPYFCNKHKNKLFTIIVNGVIVALQRY